MRTTIQSGQDLPQFEAVALIYEERRPEPGLVRENLGNGGTDKSFPLEEARRLAQAILRLDGLTAPRLKRPNGCSRSTGWTSGGCGKSRAITRC
jgi:hypothetical protein